MFHKKGQSITIPTVLYELDFHYYGQPGSIQHPQTVWVEHDRGYDAHGGAMNDQASHASVEPGSVRSGLNSWYHRQRPIIPMGEQGARAEDVICPVTSSSIKANSHSGWLSCRIGAFFGGWDMKEPLEWDFQADIGGRNRVPMDRFLSDTSDRRHLYDSSRQGATLTPNNAVKSSREIYPRAFCVNPESSPQNMETLAGMIASRTRW
jgi:hypothetical protein